MAAIQIEQRPGFAGTRRAFGGGGHGAARQKTEWYSQWAETERIGERRKRLGTRWASRTSNPVSGSRQVGGGFDSHTLPPSQDRGYGETTDAGEDLQGQPRGPAAHHHRRHDRRRGGGRGRHRVVRIPGGG